ncbi:hypothetical protein F2S72_08840 [Pseudomonas syringae pv. actinidiae]|nr:hypothetical protein [Pseudomonas syringae pv. actinidiae]
MSNLDFEHQYREAVAEMARAGAPDAITLPSLVELTAAIIHGAEGEHVPAQTFDEFFEWWDAFTGYDQLDEGAKAIDHKPLLKVAYDALKTSGHL